MKIVLATDGSAQAELAASLAASIPWPDGTTIRLVRVVEPVPPGLELAEDRRAELNESVLDTARSELTAVAFGLAAPSRHVETRVAHGDAGDVIIDAAADCDADLVIVGSRRLGPIGTALLGSTSAAVVDGAPCPVLVARRAAITSVVFAEDGSIGAREAANLLLAWPFLRSLPTRVVSVAHVATPLASGVAPTVHAAAVGAYRESLAEARALHHSLAEETAARFRAAGIASEIDVREGDAAEELMAAADEVKSDLIVMGSRGHRGLTRLMLGSVARKVLTHAPCSVLVVRQHGAL